MSTEVLEPGDDHEDDTFAEHLGRVRLLVGDDGSVRAYRLGLWAGHFLGGMLASGMDDMRALQAVVIITSQKVDQYLDADGEDGEE